MVATHCATCNDEQKKYGSAACTPFFPENKVNLYRLPFLPRYFLGKELSS